MTLPEVLVAMVVAAIILQGAVGFFVGQSRVVGENESQRSARDASRAAMNVFMADLRRVETVNGVTHADDSTLDLRVPFALGIVCGTDMSGMTVSLLPTDSVRLERAATAGFAGFAIRSGTGAWGSFTTSSGMGTGSSSACSTAGAGVFDARYVRTLSPGVSASAGDLVLLYDRIRYEFVDDGDGLVLTRSINGVAAEPLVGAFDADETRFRFFAAGSSVASNSPPGNLQDMRGVQIVLHGRGDRPGPGGGAVSTAPLTASVFFKNLP